MRIISGKFKGRNIGLPRGIRPTQNKVRKALFDILGDIQGLSFLELFAGSGAVGLEALSQGAGRAVFVEKDRACINKIRQGISVMGVEGCRVIESGVRQALSRLAKRKEGFDIVFLDPPYYRDLAKKTLKMLAQYDILSPNGLIICQHFKKDILPEAIDGFRLVKLANYGDTALSFYKRE